jgi:hypothetical protein
MTGTGLDGDEEEIKVKQKNPYGQQGMGRPF